jgi:hypothetical protein
MMKLFFIESVFADNGQDHYDYDFVADETAKAACAGWYEHHSDPWVTTILLEIPLPLPTTPNSVDATGLFIPPRPLEGDDPDDD